MAFRDHLRTRSRAFAFIAAFALGSVVSRRAPPARTVDGLSRLLSRASGGLVKPSDVSWEAPSGVLSEALFGRRILFLASVGEGGARDVFRAKIRLSAEGHPVEACGVRNLTRTPRGDDTALDVRAGAAAFATTAAGRVHGVTVLDLAGMPEERLPRSFVGRTLAGLSAFLRTGALAGLGETHVAWALPPRAARLSLEPPRLRLALEDPDFSLEIDFVRGDGHSSEGAALPPGVEVFARDESERARSSLAREIARQWLGSSGIVLARAAHYGADLLRRVRAGLAGSPRVKAGAALAAQQSRAATFPPPDLAPILEPENPGEGHWAPLSAPWLASFPGAPHEGPTYFATTFLRPDARRPGSEVVLVAMNFRMLEIGVEGGYALPEPDFGAPGAGRLPRSPSELSRVVAVMNGGDGTRANHHGLRVRRRNISLPSEDTTTLVVTDEGSAGLGLWPGSFGEANTLLQGTDALAVEGAAEARSALCRLGTGDLLYAWGKSLSGSALARALRRAGCERALGLARGSGALGFALLHAGARDGKRAELRLARPDMPLNPLEYLTGSERDFLYVKLRDTEPRSAGGAGGGRWSVSPGPQPDPPWLPGVFESRLPSGELTVQLWSFESGRVDWALQAGSGEPGMAGGRSKKMTLSPEVRQRAVAVIGLGHTTDALRYGLSFQGQSSLDLRQSYATVVLSASRPPRISAPGERPTLLPDEDAVQLPLLADAGEIDPRGVDRGSLRVRGAACVTAGGRFLVAVARHDSSEPIAQALLESGCTRVVALDRGSRHPAFVERSASGEPPREASEETCLVAISRPMSPRTFAY